MSCSPLVRRWLLWSYYVFCWYAIKVQYRPVIFGPSVTIFVVSANVSLELWMINGWTSDIWSKRWIALEGSNDSQQSSRGSCCWQFTMQIVPWFLHKFISLFIFWWQNIHCDCCYPNQSNNEMANIEPGYREREPVRAQHIISNCVHWPMPIRPSLQKEIKARLSIMVTLYFK